MDKINSTKEFGFMTLPVNILIISFILLTALFTCSLSAGVSGQQDTTDRVSIQQKSQSKISDMKSSMMHMHKNMISLKITGDPDYDFARMMLEHHKGAIDLDKKEILNGKDEDVLLIAKLNMDKQNNELTLFQTFIANNKPEVSKLEGKSDMTGSMDTRMISSVNDMMNKMQKLDLKGDQDYDFASMMIMHNQQAIDLAKDYLNNGKDEKLKQTAQQIISEDPGQIQKLEQWKNKEK